MWIGKVFAQELPIFARNSFLDSRTSLRIPTDRYIDLRVTQNVRN